MGVVGAAAAFERAEHTSDLRLVHPSLMELLWLCHNARDDEREQYTLLTGLDWDADAVAAEFYQAPGFKWVGLLAEKPIFAGGYQPVVNRVYQSWMVGTEENWRLYWRTITKSVRQVMETMFDNGALRLQTCVLASRTLTREWYERGCKMTFEGYMPGFGKNGEIMAMYARVKE